MKISRKQQKDIESATYFIPEVMKNIKINSEDEQMFLEWSEKGFHKDKIGNFPCKMDGFNALVQGKEWRGVHVGIFEEGVLDGTMPYITIFEFAPQSVKEFMASEMFKGADKEIILSL